MQPANFRGLISANNDRKSVYKFLAITYATEATADILRDLCEKKEQFLNSAQNREIRGSMLADGFRQIADFVVPHWSRS